MNKNLKRPEGVHPEAERKVDYASALLLATGIVCSIGALWLIFAQDFTALVIIPSLFAIRSGSRDLFMWAIPRNVAAKESNS